MKKLLTTLLFALIFSPLAQAESATADSAQTAPQTEKEVNLFIKEMNCQLCVYLVNKELRAIDGVQSTKADMHAHKVKIIADANVPTEKLVQAIEKLHYTPEVI